MQKISAHTYFAVSEHRATNNTKSPKVILIFGGWLTLPFYYSSLIKKFRSKGFDCVLYIPKRKLVAIGTEYAHMLHAADAATADAKERLGDLENPDKTEVAVFGVSLGSIFAIEIAKRIKQVKRVALLTPTGDFIEHVKAWQNHFYFKRIVASQPTNPLESGELLNKIGSLKNLNLMKDKDVLLGFAVKDSIMHQAIARELAIKLREVQVTPVVVEVKGGHNTGLFRYLFNKDYVEFLTRE